MCNTQGIAIGQPDDRLPRAVESALHALTRVHSSALAPALLAQYGEWEQLRDFDPALVADKYPDVKAFAIAYQAASLLAKATMFGTMNDSDRETATLEKWLATEERCKLTNDRFESVSDGLAELSWMGEMRSLIAFALDGRAPDSQFLTRVEMGPISTIDEVVGLCGFGPGAMVGFPGQETCLSQKYGVDLTVTRDLMPFASSLMPAGWINLRSKGVYETSGNEWFSVPKSAVIYRSCAKEPGLNSWLQLGIGRTMRRRLKRNLGVDLRKQWEWNRYLMEVATEWDLVTIDLSSASDLLATLMCLWMMPYRWFHLCDLARSHVSTMPDGSIRVLEKFCSMGNGFTFPLQTLLFTALVRTTVPVEEHCLTSVFGDDIIVPRKYAETLIDRLEFLGLQVNTSKTHLAGVFRESCGVDTFNGVNVRPAYRRDKHETDPVSWANAWDRWLRRMTAVPGMSDDDLRLLEASWLTSVRCVPRDFRLPGPLLLGDSVVAVPPSWMVLPRGALPGDPRTRGPYSGFPVCDPFSERSISYAPGDRSAPPRAFRLGKEATTWDGFIVHKALRRTVDEMDRKAGSVLAMDLHRRDLGTHGNDVLGPLPFEQADNSLPVGDARMTRGYEPIRGAAAMVSEKWVLSYWPELAARLNSES